MASIRKRTLPGGKIKWLCDYKDATGKRRARQFPTKREADAFMVQARAEVAQGIHTPDSMSVTVAEAARHWLARGEADNLERSTMDSYSQHLELHIKPLIGEVKLSRLSTPQVEQFRDDLLKRCSRPMARKVLTSLKAILKEAQRRGLVSQNAAAATTIRMATRDKKEVVIPSKADIRALMAGAPERWRTLIMMATLTGLRASELRGLTWDLIDFKKSIVKVRQRADRYGKIGSPKSAAGRRDVPLAPMLVKALKEWKLAGPHSPGNFVFPADKGTILSAFDIGRLAWRPTLLSAGLMKPRGTAPYKFHALRHAAASLFIDHGWPPKKIQRLMGHSSITQTFDTYGHLFPDADDDQAAMASIETLLMTGPATAGRDT